MKEYSITNIYNDNGLTFDEIMNDFILSFLDNEFDLEKNIDIVNIGIDLN